METHYFLGMEVPEQAGQFFQQTIRRLKGVCSYRNWTDAADYHLTLFFFGALSDGQVDRLLPLFEKVAVVTVSFPLRLSGVNGFGDPAHPRVIYMGLEHSPQLHSLRKKLERSLVETGIRMEMRPFHPHMTLAKHWMAGNPITKPADESMSCRGWTARQIVLFKVCPGCKPRYSIVAAFPFST
ncbi:MAG: RNA 2',3'-cyclic phosphodiesterase [Sporolactobacillus sp.]